MSPMFFATEPFLQQKQRDEPEIMANIYLSSTYSDLTEHREAVYDILRKLGHDVIAMEDYVATGRRPLDKCLADVVDCDLYVGVFAWRYGFIPPTGNPEQKSITELEYRQAIATNKPRLIFLLKEDAAWSPQRMDAVTGDAERGALIATLRDELGLENTVSFFKTPDDLASLIGAAVTRELQSLGREYHNWRNEADQKLLNQQARATGVIAEISAMMFVDLMRLLGVRSDATVF